MSIIRSHVKVARINLTMKIHMKWYHVTNLDMWHPFVAVAGVRQSLSLQMLSAVLNCRCLTRLNRALKRRSRFHSQLNYTTIGGTNRFIHQQIWYRFVNFPGVDIGQCGSMWIIDVLPSLTSCLIHRGVDAWENNHSAYSTTKRIRYPNPLFFPQGHLSIIYLWFHFSGVHALQTYTSKQVNEFFEHQFVSFHCVDLRNCRSKTMILALKYLRQRMEEWVC